MVIGIAPYKVWVPWPATSPLGVKNDQPLDADALHASAGDVISLKVTEVTDGDEGTGLNTMAVVYALVIVLVLHEAVVEPPLQASAYSA
jgi:hypothetical protein